jgi:hypothetical protein
MWVLQVIPWETALAAAMALPVAEVGPLERFEFLIFAACFSAEIGRRFFG